MKPMTPYPEKKVGVSASVAQLTTREAIIVAFEEHSRLDTSQIVEMTAKDPQEVRKALRFFERQEMLVRDGRRHRNDVGQPPFIWKRI